jgi:hypothetical protein
MADIALPHRLLSGLCALMLVSSPLVGCDPKAGPAGGGPSGSAAPGTSGGAASDQPAASTSGQAAARASGATVLASAVAGAAAAAAVPSSEISSTPVGSGLTDFVALDKKTCAVNSNDVGRYLKRGELSIAGREGAIGIVWLIDLTSKVQVAFAGFDNEARQTLRGRGVGLAREHAPRVFSTGADWTVTWLDPKGLAYTRPQAQTLPAPDIEHLSSISSENAEYAAIAATPGGPLVAVAPFGADRAQLALFLFAPTQPDAPPIQAVGVTKHAKSPRNPAIAADASGYYVAWLEEGGRIAASHFDAAGKETDAHAVMPPTEAKREQLAIVAAGGGAVVAWTEGEVIHARGLDREARPFAPPQVVGRGKWPILTSSGDGAFAAWVGKGRTAADQLVVVRLAASGAPAPKGLEITDGNAVRDPPSLAFAGARAAASWTEVMGATVSTKRLIIRLFDPACVPAQAP